MHQSHSMTLQTRLIIVLKQSYRARSSWRRQSRDVCRRRVRGTRGRSPSRCLQRTRQCPTSCWTSRRQCCAPGDASCLGLARRSISVKDISCTQITCSANFSLAYLYFKKGHICSRALNANFDYGIGWHERVYVYFSTFLQSVSSIDSLPLK